MRIKNINSHKSSKNDNNNSPSSQNNNSNHNSNNICRTVDKHCAFSLLLCSAKSCERPFQTNPKLLTFKTKILGVWNLLLGCCSLQALIKLETRI